MQNSIKNKYNTLNFSHTQSYMFVHGRNCSFLTIFKPGGALSNKSDGGARRTFIGFKSVDWYRFGCLYLK